MGPPRPLFLFSPISHIFYVFTLVLAFFFSFCRCSSVLVVKKKTAIDRSHGYRRDCLRYRDPRQQFLLLFFFPFHFFVIFILALRSLRFGFCRVARAKNGSWNVSFPSMKGETHRVHQAYRAYSNGKKEWNSSDAFHRKLSFTCISVVLHRETAAPGSFSSLTISMNRYPSIHHTCIRTYTHTHVAKNSRNENDLREKRSGRINFRVITVW